MNITGKGSILILLLSIGFISSTFGAERPLARNQNILAIAPDNFVCAEAVPVTVRAPDESDFQGDMIKLQRLIAGLRTALKMECPQAKEITLIGETQGRAVYHGVVSESSGWVLVEIMPTKETGATAISAQAAKTTDTQPCNTLAAGSPCKSMQVVVYSDF